MPAKVADAIKVDTLLSRRPEFMENLNLESNASNRRLVGFRNLTAMTIPQVEGRATERSRRTKPVPANLAGRASREVSITHPKKKPAPEGLGSGLSNCTDQ